MKRPAYTIQIENPCNEDWSKMESTGTGKFCAHCQHSVIDFTRLTDTQVIALIEKTEGQICGRFNNHQLNRIMQETGPTQNPALYKILAAMLLLSTTNMIAQPVSNTQIESIKTKNTVGNINEENHEHKLPDILPVKIVKGIVIDETTTGVGFASILLADKLVATTDSAGNFEFTIPNNMVGQELMLKTESTNHSTAFNFFKPEDLNKAVIIQIKGVYYTVGRISPSRGEPAMPREKHKKKKHYK